MDSLEKMRQRSERMKELFPPGTRIVLEHMDDPYHLVPPGTRGSVESIDANGTIFPKWDNGSGLGLVYGEDSFRRLTPEELEEERLATEQETGRDVGMQM